MRVESIDFRFARSHRLVARIVANVDALRILGIERHVVSMNGCVAFFQAVGQFDFDTITDVDTQCQRMRHMALIRCLFDFPFQSENFRTGISQEKFTFKVDLDLIFSIGMKLQRFVDSNNTEALNRSPFRAQSLLNFFLKGFVTRKNFQIFLNFIMHADNPPASFRQLGSSSVIVKIITRHLLKTTGFGR